jgi:hypothetical protein
MNRRNFLSTLAVGAPAVLLAAKIAPLEAIKQDHRFQNNGASTGICKLCGDGITGLQHWGIAPDGLMSRDGQDTFTYYRDDGGPEGYVRYYYNERGIFEHRFRHDKLVEIKRIL